MSEIHADNDGAPISPQDAPCALIAVAPHRELKAFDGVTPGRGPELYRVRPLREALLDTYTTDAHFVAYVVEGREMQPRILKRAWERIGAPVSVGVLFADVDTPDHGPWDFDFYDHVMTCFEQLPDLEHAGLYFTMHGARIVQPLDRRFAVADVEPVLEAWLHSLRDAGLHRDQIAHVDLTCRDWTRHFRAPNVRRETRGRRKRVEYTSPRVDLGRMAPIAPPAPRAVSPPARPRAKVPRPRALAPATVELGQGVTEAWRRGARLLADACGRISDGRHGLYLALAGALVDRGLSPEHLPALVRAIATGAGNDPRVEDRVRAARTTVDRVHAGDAIQSVGTLRLRWPEIAGALEVAVDWAANSHVEPASNLREAEAAMEEAIRAAPDGVTIVAAECGLGKTHAAVQVAIERAQKPQSGSRAPLDSKTVLSAPTHALAVQVCEDLRAQGVKVRRHFSPASLVDEHGARVCKKHEIALPLIQGGQSQRYEVCEGRGIAPCEYLSSCPAARGWEGDEDARVVVGVHALLPMLTREAGKTGLLVVDEPPPLPHADPITLGDLDATRDELGSFDGIFAAALKPALNALWAWLRYSPSEAPVGLREALQAQRWAERDEDLAWARAGTNETTDDLGELAMAAVSDEHGRRGPPLKWEAVQIATTSAQASARIGRASRVLNTLHFALTTKGDVKLYATGEDGEQQAAVIAHVYEPLARALGREGRTVVLDANAETNLPLYAKALGYEPELLTFAAADGAPIERTLLRCAKATRTGWKVQADRFDVESGSFQNVLEAVIDWALVDPDAKSLAIITMKPIRELLEDCLRTDDQIPDDRYARRGSLLKAARARLGPTLRRWGGELLWGHYGAVRGLNHMRDVDLLVTIGDPRPNVTATENDLVLLGLEDDAAGRRVDALARAELEQAQGRLRACRRTRPARALHVGTLLPSGTGWSGEVEFRELIGGRPKNVGGGITLVKLRAIVDELGGVSQAARIIRVPRTTLHHYVKGGTEAPPDVIGRIQSAWSDEVRNKRAT